jgi:hypothetical protein
MSIIRLTYCSIIVLLKVISVGKNGERIDMSTKFLEKPSTECNEITEIILIITVVVISMLILLAIAAIAFYYKKFPNNRLRRARSRVYSRLYAK